MDNFLNTTTTTTTTTTTHSEPMFEGDFLEHFMHQDDMFSDMIEPTFDHHPQEPDLPPPPQPHSPTSPPTPPQLPERTLFTPKRPREHSDKRTTTTTPNKKTPDHEQPTRSPRHESITSRLGPTRSQRRTSRSPPPLKRQALDPRRPSQRTAEANSKVNSPSSSHSRNITCTKERLLQSSRSPALCSRTRSRSRSPPRGPSAYRKSDNRRGDSTDRESLVRKSNSRSRQPLPPQNEARAHRLHDASKEDHRTMKRSPEKSTIQTKERSSKSLDVESQSGKSQQEDKKPPRLTDISSKKSSSQDISKNERSQQEDITKNQPRSTDNPPKEKSQQEDIAKNQPRSTDIPPKKSSSSSNLNPQSRSTDIPPKESSSSSNLNSLRDDSPSPPRAPAALRKYSLHQSPNLSPAQVARAAKAAAEASRYRNLQKREQNQHRPSSFSRTRTLSSSRHRASRRSSEITLMDDSQPPPTAPAADLRNGKQRQSLPSSPGSNAGDKDGNGKTGPSLTNRNHSSSHGSLTPVEPSGRRRTEGGDKSPEDVDRRKGKRSDKGKGSDGSKIEGQDADYSEPPLKLDRKNRSPSLPKKPDPSQNNAHRHPPFANPKKSLPKRYRQNGNIHSADYWSGNTMPPTFDRYGMIPNIGMTMNMMHNPAMNPNMAMMGANMIPFMQNANGMHGSGRMNFLNQGMDMNMGMGDGYGMEYQGLDLDGMHAGLGMGMPMAYSDVGLGGKDGMNSPWAGSENEGSYSEGYNYVSNGLGNNADVNSGIMGMSDASEYLGNGAQNPWYYSASSIAGSDFNTDYGDGVPTSTRTFNVAARTFNRSRTFNVTSTPSMHDSDAQNSTDQGLVGDTSSVNSHLDSSSSAGRETKPKRRGASYNNRNVPLIRFVGTPPPDFPFSNFQYGQIPPPPPSTQFLNSGYFG